MAALATFRIAGVTLRGIMNPSAPGAPRVQVNCLWRLPCGCCASNLQRQIPPVLNWSVHPMNLESLSPGRAWRARALSTLAVITLVGTFGLLADPVEPEEPRAPKSDAELQAWLQNMYWHHRFSVVEIGAATGLTKSEVNAA